LCMCLAGRSHPHPDNDNRDEAATQHIKFQHYDGLRVAASKPQVLGMVADKETAMRMVCQRVLEAKVTVNGQPVGSIGRGLLVYLGVGKGDTESDAQFIADKIVNLRIFSDEAGKMNLSVQDVAGAILLISNFTLHGDCRKGRRPGFDAAAEPVPAEQLYEKVAGLISEQGVPVEKGVFGEYMHVTSINDGPVTFLLDSAKLF
jgi:D-tyrosyl-tRNA(Tyr) deacylase